jgi:hypothetical protein
MDPLTTRDRWLETIATLRAQDSEKAVISYDYDSDELMIRFGGSNRPGVGRLLGDGWLLRLDRETDEPIGLQVEGFLARTAPLHPHLLSLLDLADLRGITVEALAIERRRIVAAGRDRVIKETIEAIPARAFAAD